MAGSTLRDLLGISIIDNDPGVSMPVFRSGPIALRGMRFDLLHCQWDEHGVDVRVSVPDRDTDVPVEIKFRAGWPERPRDYKHLASMLESAMAWMVAHEIAERMLIAGRRDDPHDRPQGPPPFIPMRLPPEAMGPWSGRDFRPCCGSPRGYPHAPRCAALEPCDEVAILMRGELLQYINEYRAKLDLPRTDASDQLFGAVDDFELRGLVRSLRTRPHH